MLNSLSNYPNRRTSKMQCCLNRDEITVGDGVRNAKWISVREMWRRGGSNMVDVVIEYREYLRFVSEVEGLNLRNIRKFCFLIFLKCFSFLFYHRKIC